MDAMKSAMSAATGTLSIQKSAQAASSLQNSGTRTAALEDAAKQFEATFLSQMFSHMFESIKTDSLFGGGHGEEMFRSMLVDEYAKEVVKNGGVGVADNVLRTLLAQQETSK